MGNNGSRWVFMGVLGCRDMKPQQNEVIRDKHDQTGHILRPYDRRNFPKRHVCEDNVQKRSNAYKYSMLCLDGRSRMWEYEGTGAWGGKRVKRCEQDVFDSKFEV